MRFLIGLCERCREGLCVEVVGNVSGLRRVHTLDEPPIETLTIGGRTGAYVSRSSCLTRIAASYSLNEAGVHRFISIVWK